MWEAVQNFVEKCHPNKAVVGQVINLLKDKAMPHLPKIPRRRQNQCHGMGSLLKLQE